MQMLCRLLGAFKVHLNQRRTMMIWIPSAPTELILLRTAICGRTASNNQKNLCHQISIYLFINRRIKQGQWREPTSKPPSILGDAERSIAIFFLIDSAIFPEGFRLVGRLLRWNPFVRIGGVAAEAEAEAVVEQASG